MWSNSRKALWITLKVRDEAGDCFGMGLLINLSEDAEGRTWHSCTVGASRACVSSVFESWSSGRRGWAALCFSPAERKKNNKTKKTDWLKRLQDPTELGCLLWLTCLIPGRCKTSPIGGVVILSAGEEDNTFWQGVQHSLAVESRRRLMNVGGKHVTAVKFFKRNNDFYWGWCECQYLHTTLSKNKVWTWDLNKSNSVLRFYFKISQLFIKAKLITIINLFLGHSFFFFFFLLKEKKKK